jgi:hypothetical protein
MPAATTSLQDLQAKASTAWRNLVRTTAKTGRPPEGRDLIDNAIILGLADPGDRFEAEVRALRDHTSATADVKRLKAEEATEAVALEARSVKLAELEAQCEDLRRTMFAKSWSIGSDLGEAEATVSRLEKSFAFLASNEEVAK